MRAEEYLSTFGILRSANLGQCCKVGLRCTSCWFGVGLMVTQIGSKLVVVNIILESWKGRQDNVLL